MSSPDPVLSPGITCYSWQRNVTLTRVETAGMSWSGLQLVQGHRADHSIYVQVNIIEKLENLMDHANIEH